MKTNVKCKLCALFVFFACSAVSAAVEITDLSALGGFATHDLATNDSGQVVGYYTLPGDIHHAFLYAKGAFTDIAPPGSLDSYASGINNHGQIIGTYNYVNHPATTSAFIYDNGTFTIIGYGHAEYAQTTPNSINDGGVIVGTMLAYPWHGTRQSDYLLPHAFMYKDGAMTDLNTLLPFGSEWELVEATKINIDGSIVGRGLIHGETRDFLLSW